MLRAKTILILSPHADDVEIGCGGIIARAVAEGSKVVVALATVGGASTAPSETRLLEFTASMRVLGVHEHILMSMGFDGCLHTKPMDSMVAQFDALQEQLEPDIVILPLPSFHQDHRYCWEFGIASTRPSPKKWFPTTVAAYEYPLSFWGGGEKPVTGVLHVDVTPYWGSKIKALQCYKSQMGGDLGLISEYGAEALAKLRGLEVGVRYSEVLYILRARV